MYDAVLGAHTNPLTCGVSKFNAQLAARLGVPHRALDAWQDRPFQSPLVSIKASELGADWWHCLPGGAFDLLLHDRPVLPARLRARRVFYADTLGCPATVHGDPTRGTYRVLTFGMAHKLVLVHFARLKDHLDLAHPDYTISLSTAVHEGSPWALAIEESTAAMRALFGSRLRVLGFLLDDALAKELQECDAVAAYFVPALRANHTSAWATVAAGKHLYTNTDAASPDLTRPPTWDGLLAQLEGAGVAI